MAYRFKLTDIDISKKIYAKVGRGTFIADDVKDLGITYHDLSRIRISGAIDRAGKRVVNERFRQWKWVYQISPAMLMKVSG
jgi:hypothetical protein